MEEENYSWNFSKAGSDYRPLKKSLSKDERQALTDRRKAGIFTGPYIDDNVYAQNKYGYVLSHNSQLENPLELDKFVNTKYHKGWKWNKNVDLDGDGNFDTVVYDASGKPVVWNGYHYVPNVNMLERENFMRDENNAQYNYSMKKYKWERKSSYEKVISTVAKICYNYIKEQVKDAENKKVILADLSTQFFKTFIKQSVLVPNFITQTNIVHPNAYKNELLKAAAAYKANPDYKMSVQHEIMKVFKLAGQYYDELPDDLCKALAERLRTMFNANQLNKILSDYMRIGPFKAGDKLRFAAEYVNVV